MVLLGVATGALMTWLLGRGKLTAQVDAAVARTEATLQSELTQLRERGRIGEEARRTEQLGLEAMKRESEGWRTALNHERATTATLTERVSRVPILETEAGVLGERLAVYSADVSIGILNLHRGRQPPADPSRRPPVDPGSTPSPRLVGAKRSLPASHRTPFDPSIVSIRPHRRP